jgi:hypothetical protein
VLEGQGADVLGAQSVGAGGENLLGRKLDDFAGAEAGLGIGAQFRLDANDFDVGFRQFDRG